MCMKHTDHIREINKAAKAAGLDVILVRQGGEHEVWRCGGTQFAIPRHRELTPGVVDSIRRKLETAFGKGWWK